MVAGMAVAGIGGSDLMRNLKFPHCIWRFNGGAAGTFRFGNTLMRQRECMNEQSEERKSSRPSRVRELSVGYSAEASICGIIEFGN